MVKVKCPRCSYEQDYKGREGTRRENDEDYISCSKCKYPFTLGKGKKYYEGKNNKNANLSV